MGVAFYSLSLQKEETLVSMNRTLCRHWIRSEVCWLEHTKRLLPEIEKWSFGLLQRSLFPILTELHRLPLMKVNIWGKLIQKRCKQSTLFLPLWFVVHFHGCFAPLCLARTAATPKQVSWYRNAWRRNRIRGLHNKLTNALGPISCIIADWGAAYHFHT